MWQSRGKDDKEDADSAQTAASISKLLRDNAGAAFFFMGNGV